MNYFRTSQFVPNKYLYTSYEGHWGYLVEALVYSKMISNFSLAIGINYNANRYKVKHEYEYFRYDGIMYSSYVNIPLLLNYKIPTTQQFSVSAGIFLGYRVSTFDRFELVTKEGFSLLNSNPNYLINEYKVTHPRRFEKENYGLILQADYEYKLNQRLSAVVFGRFNYGLKNTIKKLRYEYNNRIWKTYDIALGFGLNI